MTVDILEAIRDLDPDNDKPQRFMTPADSLRWQLEMNYWLHGEWRDNRPQYWTPTFYPYLEGK